MMTDDLIHAAAAVAGLKRIEDEISRGLTAKIFYGRTTVWRAAFKLSDPPILLGVIESNESGFHTWTPASELGVREATDDLVEDSGHVIVPALAHEKDGTKYTEKSYAISVCSCGWESQAFFDVRDAHVAWATHRDGQLGPETSL